MAGGGDLVRRAPCGDGVKIGHDDMRACFRQHAGDVCADPGRGPRHERHAAIETEAGQHRSGHQAAARMKASKMRSSPGLIEYSGCHSTPMQKRRRGSSIPSITPSGASALTTMPEPTAFTAW